MSMTPRAARWLKMAEDARRMADRMRDPDGKRIMLKIADSYDELFAEYRTLHDYFAGGRERGGNDVLHRLRSRRNGATPG